MLLFDYDISKILVLSDEDKRKLPLPKNKTYEEAISDACYYDICGLSASVLSDNLEENQLYEHLNRIKYLIKNVKTINSKLIVFLNNKT